MNSDLWPILLRKNSDHNNFSFSGLIARATILMRAVCNTGIIFIWKRLHKLVTSYFSEHRLFQFYKTLPKTHKIGHEAANLARTKALITQRFDHQIKIKHRENFNFLLLF